MSLSAESFDILASHWAVSFIGDDELKRADKLVQEHLAHREIGEHITFSYKVDQKDTPFLNKVALAYEMAATEGLSELTRSTGANRTLRDQAMAASYKMFDLLRLMPVPDEINDQLFFVLRFSAVAYCGDRWSDLHRWYQKNDEALDIPSVENVPWDRRLLYRLFLCWVRLFRKQTSEDLDSINEIIAGLRDDQKEFEAASLNNGSPTANRSMGFRLIALYHWARATEILACYMLKGQPASPLGALDRHFDAAQRSAAASGDAQHEIIIRWLHASARIMVANSLWWATRTINSKMSEFVHSLTARSHHPMFELLPPQRAALLEKGLLDQAKTAIVVDLPTSGGKTLLAQFRILQALNQFHADHGWVAYVAPTKALVAQITRRLRKDFEPIGLRIEQLTAAVDVDAFENEFLADDKNPFDILVATPEKLSLVIRNKRVERPLALLVMDEAHNLEDKECGLRIEFLLAVVKRDCPHANFILLMPYAEETESIAHWLAHDTEAGQAISLGTTPWKPNERIIGLYRAVADSSKRAGWRLLFETLSTTPKALPLSGRHSAGGIKPLDVPKHKVLSRGEQKGLGHQTIAMAKVMSEAGTSIAIARTTPDVWNMARRVTECLPEPKEIPEEIRLVQKFVSSEISPNFQLVEFLEKGVGVHHSKLSDETRALMEWLAESGKLRLLCATTTIAQGLNFPVSSVFLQTHKYPYGKEMSPREFWNLAGRAGRINHDSIGVIGIAAGKKPEEIIEFIGQSTGKLVSRLVRLMDDLEHQGKVHELSKILDEEQWEDFRCYIAHLLAEKKTIDAVLADTNQLLLQTFGYTSLRSDPKQHGKAEALLEATQNYAMKLGENLDRARLADSTGFSPEGVAQAMKGMRTFNDAMAPADWAPESLFADGGKMADLFGVMLKVPQLNRQLRKIAIKGIDHSRLSEITLDWVNGERINDIAQKYFRHGEDEEASTNALTEACKAIYRIIVNNGAWGISALSRMSGINFDTLAESGRRQINALPAMIYHGVKTEDAVLMRMNSAPRSTAEALGSLYRESNENDVSRYSVGKARNFLKKLEVSDWEKVVPEGATLTGAGYKQVWEILSGE